MAERSNVPKFGNWEEDNVPYTVCFDKARKKTKGQKMINPNDPQQNPEMFRNIGALPLDPPAPLKPKTKAEEPFVRGSVQPIHEHKVSREDIDFRQFSNSTARSENMGRRIPGESGYGGRVNRLDQSSRSGAVPEYSFENAPRRPQVKSTGRGIGAAAWEGANYETGHGVRARSRQGAVPQEDNSPDKGASVPIFGNWNEAENLTVKFNKIREERNTPNHASSTPKYPAYSPRIQPSKEPKARCFPCW